MKILIVDDESSQRDLLRGFLANQGYDVLTAADGEEACSLFSREPIQLAILDHRMPGLTGEEVLKKLKALNPMVHAIIITAYGNVDTAVTTIKLGADDFLEKPVDLSVLLQKIQQIEGQVVIEEDVASVNEAIETSTLPLKIVAQSPAMKRVLALARKIAQSSWTVLIGGETGTGKELLAHLIHLLSPRGDNAFIEVNCAAIPENLFESELFGHEKGAFTGAIGRRRGHFEIAHGGTLFLDEITEMPLVLQPKLLHVLQEKRFSRIGGEKPIDVDIRLISATNRNLKKMVEDGTFREDLYYRIKVLEVEIPPLRQRREDIPELIQLFLDRYSTQPIRFSLEAMDALVKYPYPGNVRELEHIVQRAITFARGQLIALPDLPEEIRHHQSTTQGTLAENLEAMEKEMLLDALEKNSWVQTRAAAFLGISERVLRYKMKKYDLKNTPHNDHSS
ncbi:MAG: two component system response regulator, sigma54-specific [Deltaproteobacteria bacterium]|nr:two component system response regulator, sigma54-specific [Deltaproteobacteria bacterium]